MILIDVFFPELDRTIDFQVDETVRAWDIAEELAGMAAQSSGRSFSQKEHCVLLYSAEKGCQLDPGRTLKGNGIQSGDKLILI